jgi:hypothetical protein
MHTGYDNPYTQPPFTTHATGFAADAEVAALRLRVAELEAELAAERAS